MFGTGLVASNLTAKAPYPTTLNNVTVTVNGTKAPIYSVTHLPQYDQINCLIPYGTTGATATIVVTNGSTPSNTVTVPVAATSPGIYSLDQSGSGSGAIEHANGSIVNAGNPANPGETVVVYLTGMGAVTPAVADGTASTGNPLNKTVQPMVYVADQQANVMFSGLAPGFPGLYQLNVTIPMTISSAGNFPVGDSDEQRIPRPDIYPRAVAHGSAYAEARTDSAGHVAIRSRCDVIRIAARPRSLRTTNPVPSKSIG